MEQENDIQEVAADETSEVAEEKSDETTDWKARAEELEQKAIKQREKTKELKAKLSEFEASVPTKKSNDFDYGQKAFLKTYGISGADELALVKTWTDRTGDSIDTLVTDELFNMKLKALREAKAVKEAIPISTNRSASQVSNKLDYWLEKYNQGTPLKEVPFEIRNEVLNARLKADENKSKFGG